MVRFAARPVLSPFGLGTYLGRPRPRAAPEGVAVRPAMTMSDHAASSQENRVPRKAFLWVFFKYGEKAFASSPTSDPTVPRELALSSDNYFSPSGDTYSSQWGSRSMAAMAVMGSWKIFSHKRP